MNEQLVCCELAGRLRLNSAPGPAQDAEESPPPGANVIEVGLATASAHTGPAVTVMLTFRHWPRGTQNHSGKPTSPFRPMGGAVCAVSVGTDSSPMAILSSSTGLMAGAPVVTLTWTSWPPSGPWLDPGQVMMSHW